MKTRSLICLLSAFLVASAPSVQAQEYEPVPVTVSKERVRLNGKVYLSHVVLERQTLYSISKAYGVTIEEITAANPSILEKGLQKNSIILIPNESATPQQSEKTRKEDSKKEETAQEQTVKEDAPAPAEEENPGYKIHTVKWFENLGDIAAKYNIPKEDIMEFNGLTSEKLQRRQKLKIPNKPLDRSGNTQVAATPAENDSEEKPEDVAIATPGQEEGAGEEAPATQQDADDEWEDFEEEVSGRDVVDVALALPFNASGRPSPMNMDFYAGVLLAVKDLEDAGIGTRLNVYDISSTSPSREQLIANDFVLGPVSSADLAAILEKTGGKVPVISPVDQRAASLKDTYSNFIQAPTPAESQYTDIVNWVRSDMSPSEKVILITEKGARSGSVAEDMMNILNASGLNFNTLSYSLIEGRSIQTSLVQKMGPGTNRVIVATESEAFLGDILRNVGIAMNKGYDVVLYAPSKVRSFDTIDPMSYHDVNLHMSSSYTVDYSDPDVKKFVMAYRALYNAEPNQFSFQGYDTAYYFIGMCSKYGRRWTKRLTDTKGNLLHTDFLFMRSDNGSLTNTAVRRTVYNKDSSTSYD